MRSIANYNVVRVISLTGAAADHLIIPNAVRAPRIGDIGMVVDIAARLGGVGHHYTVKLTNQDAGLVWLAVFAAHELEVVK